MQNWRNSYREEGNPSTTSWSSKAPSSPTRERAERAAVFERVMKKTVQEKLKEKNYEATPLVTPSGSKIGRNEEKSPTTWGSKAPSSPTRERSERTVVLERGMKNTVQEKPKEKNYEVTPLATLRGSKIGLSSLRERPEFKAALNNVIEKTVFNSPPRVVDRQNEPKNSPPKSPSSPRRVPTKSCSETPNLAKASNGKLGVVNYLSRQRSNA